MGDQSESKKATMNSVEQNGHCIIPVYSEQDWPGLWLI